MTLLNSVRTPISRAKRHKFGFEGILAVLMGFIACSSSAEARVIYGTDDRADPFDWLAQGRDSEIARLARSTAVQVIDDQLSWESAQGIYRLSGQSLSQRTLGQGLSLCPGERFANQRTSGFCSATLIAPNRILTAGHCLSEGPGVHPEQQCAHARFLFGYEAHSAQDPGTTQFLPEQVYSCKSIVRLSYDGTGETTSVPDFAIVELDRDVSGVAPVALDDRLVRFGLGMLASRVGVR